MFRLIPEKPDDRAEVEWLLDLAFAPGRGALSSYQLRQGVAPITDLCTIARDEFDAVVGCIRFWPIKIGDEGAPGLLLGPIAVHPTRQGEGLGVLLMSETLSKAREMGWTRVLLVGDAAYYQRFGFTAALTRGLEFPKPFNPERLLGTALVEGSFAGISGTVQPWHSVATNGL